MLQSKVTEDTENLFNYYFLLANARHYYFMKGAYILKIDQLYVISRLKLLQQTLEKTLLKGFNSRSIRKKYEERNKTLKASGDCNAVELSKVLTDLYNYIDKSDSDIRTNTDFMFILKHLDMYAVYKNMTFSNLEAQA